MCTQCDVRTLFEFVSESSQPIADLQNCMRTIESGFAGSASNYSRQNNLTPATWALVRIPDHREHHFRMHRERDSGLIVNSLP